MSLLLSSRFRWPYFRTGLLVLGVLGSAIAIRGHHVTPLALAATEVEGPLELLPSDVATAGLADMSDTQLLSGTLQAIRQTVLTAEVDGRIDQVLVRAGEKVMAGQVLGYMDKHDLESSLAEKRANLAASYAQLELAEKVQKRNEELLAKKFISATSVDSSRATLEANHETVKAIQAQWTRARQALGKAAIRSSISGIIAERTVEPGQHVGVNARLFVVVDLKELEFAASVPVGEIGAIRVGQEVSLSAEGSSDVYAGRVERIAPIADPASRMIPIYVRVANPDERLKGGMVARGRIKIAESPKAIALSDQAIRREGDQAYVLALAGPVEMQRVERRDLRLGVVDEVAGMVEVKSGLASGDKVLLSRISGLAPGLRVQLIAKP